MKTLGALYGVYAFLLFMFITWAAKELLPFVLLVIGNFNKYIS